MAELLITGANGQLGWALARQAAAAGVDAVAFDRAALDITDGDAVAAAVAAHRPAIVVNAAAYTAVDKAETDRDTALAVNRDGPANLATACQTHGAVLIHISTDYVFNGQKSGAYGEADPVSPLGAYGETKLAGEDAIRATTDRHVILRTAWVFGIHGHNFVKTMMRVGADRDTLRVVADQQGCPTFAGDLAGAVLAIAQAHHTGQAPADGFGTFHCAGTGATTWHGFAEAIFAVAEQTWGRRPVVEAITTADYPTPAQRPANSVLDCNRLAQVYGHRMRPWPGALAEMLGAVLEPPPTNS